MSGTEREGSDLRVMHIGHAARCAGDGERMFIAALLHLDAADLEPSPEFASLIEEIGEVTVYLQALADDFGHAQVERLAGTRLMQERSVA